MSKVAKLAILQSIFSLGLKLKLQETCKKRLQNHITVFLCQKKKTAKMRKVIKIFKSGNNGLFCKAYSLKFTKWSISD